MGLDLDDLSRRPKTSPRQTQKEIEDLVERVRRQTNFGRVKLAKYLETKYKVTLSSNTVRNILRRRKLTKQQKKRGAFKGFVFYDWEKIHPLEQFQIDLKELVDIRALSQRAPRHIRRYDLPRCQWTCLDVFSRPKLIAFSYQKTFANGKCFLILVVLWLRSFGINNRLFFQIDWGEEFGGKSIGKLQKLQKELFDPLGVQLLRIRKRR